MTGQLPCTENNAARNRAKGFPAHPLLSPARGAGAAFSFAAPASLSDHSFHGENNG